MRALARIKMVSILTTAGMVIRVRVIRVAVVLVMRVWRDPRQPVCRSLVVMVMVLVWVGVRFQTGHLSPLCNLSSEDAHFMARLGCLLDSTALESLACPHGGYILDAHIQAVEVGLA